MFTCVVCGAQFVKTGRNQKRCLMCAYKRELQHKRAYSKRTRTSSARGVNQRGVKNHNWRGGLDYTSTKLKSMSFYYCERCKIDLSDVVRVKGMQYRWGVHHKDHDHGNNAPDNLELLCKSCHQAEHRVQENFYK